MKTLKKSLCLILALVFVLGLCTIGAGAAFTDDDQITYEEAVGTMADLGILIGPGDGAYHPTDNVTRAEAAKMIAYMCLGAANAERLVAGENIIFDDVASDYWAAKYIGFCAAKGYIVGDGDGNFRPKANVTGVELAIMLLRSVGYGEMGEYVGKGWDLNAVVDALDLGVYEGSDADFDQPATREECALYVYNTMMNVQLVAYDVDYNVYEGLYADRFGTEPLTYAQKAWGLEAAYGIVMKNQATSLDKFTTIVTDEGATLKLSYETGLDVIGHEVRVLYKTVKNNELKKVYGLSDLSTVISKNSAVSKDIDATIGDILFWNNYTNAAQPVGFAPVSAAYGTAAFDLIVYNGKIIGASVSSFVIDKIVNIANGVITLASGTTGAIGYEGITALDGYVVRQQIGSLTFLYKTTKENVFITQQTNGLTYSYNYGAYTFTTADVYNSVDDVATRNLPEMGKEYTLYLDHLGNYFLVTDAAAAPVAKNYVYFLASYEKHVTSDYGTTEAWYAQVVNAAGEIVNYPTTYADVYTLTNDVYVLNVNPITGAATFASTDTDANVVDITSGLVAGSKKVTTEPWYYTANTNFIELAVGTDGAVKTLAAAKATATNALANNYAAGLQIIAVIKPVPGNAASEVVAMWIAGSATTAAATVPSSMIYVVDADATGWAVIGSKAYPTYNVYVDGVYTAAVPFSAAPAAGFYSYSKTADGVYAEVARMAPGQIVLKNDASAYVMYNGIVKGNAIADEFDGQDLSSFTFADITPFRGGVATSVAAIEALVLAGNEVTLNFATIPYMGAVVPTGIIYVTVTYAAPI